MPANRIIFAAPSPGWSIDEMEAIMLAAQHHPAELVPDARIMTATESSHNVRHDQPDLVIDTIWQVATAVRDRTSGQPEADGSLLVDQPTPTRAPTPSTLTNGAP